MTSAEPLDFAALPAAERYARMTRWIVPRPIALVSTLSPEGVANLAPYSFFMAGGSDPGSLCFSVTLSANGEKDTLRNVRATGEFVVHLVGRELAGAMNEAGASLPPDESEWPRTGFTPAPCRVVAPPRVAEAPVAFECRLHRVVEHGEGVGAARYVIGEIVFAWSAVAELDAVARLGGSAYLDMAGSERFEIARPG